jgi:hypothetical protein
MGGAVAGIESLLAELAERGHPLYAEQLVRGDVPHARARFGVTAIRHDDLRRGRFRKTDPRIFETFLERVGRRAEDGVFIDDVGVNVPPRARSVSTRSCSRRPKRSA